MPDFAVIFDMDGVLVDSNKYILDSFNQILKPHKIFINRDNFKTYMGITSRGMQDRWKRDYGLDFDKEFLAKETTRLQIQFLKKNAKTSKALLNFLKELKNHNIPIGVGTSSPRYRAEKILGFLKVKRFFSVIVDGDEIKKHKPDPEIFLKVAKALRIKSEKCVVIEDSALGIEAAKRAHMKTIGYLTRFHTRTELKDADITVNSFTKLSFKKVEKLIK